jgi:hypothetical protein
MAYTREMKRTHTFLYENLKEETDGFRCMYKNNIKMELKDV